MALADIQEYLKLIPAVNPSAAAAPSMVALTLCCYSLAAFYLILEVRLVAYAQSSQSHIRGSHATRAPSRASRITSVVGRRFPKLYCQCILPLALIVPHMNCQPQICSAHM